ncbi:DNA-binding response regulator [bacterium TMED277]|nr:MAG: DNA-binding response regulator [bacterium TMED277]
MLYDEKHILLIDDDERILSLLNTFLNQNGFITSSAKNSQEARSLLDYFEFDILIIDIMMPGETGLELLESLRKNNNIPIILLSAKGETSDKISGLELGADDYLSKPFEPKELLLRIKNLLSRNNLTEETTYEQRVKIGTKIFDLERMELQENNQVISLTTIETKLLKIFCSSPKTVIKRDRIISELGYKTGSNQRNERNVDVQVTRLRKKIEQDPKNPRFLKTIRGKGYRLLP